MTPQILILSHVPTYPVNHGNRARVHALCNYLRRRGAKIHFVYFARNSRGYVPESDASTMDRQWDQFHIVSPSKALLYLQTGNYEVDDWWDDSVGQLVQDLCAKTSYSAVLVNYIFLSKAFCYVPNNVVKVLDTHDKFSGRNKLLEEHGVKPQFFWTSVEQESRAFERADVVIAITEEEAQFFRSITDRRIITIGHIVEQVELKAKAQNVPSRFGFLGSSNSVNVKNLDDFFVEYQKAFPVGNETVEFWIYGECCRYLTHWANRCGIRLFGEIETLDAFYHRVDCVFVPFTFGTGQKIKVVEALSYGVPLITTRCASEGTYSSAPEHNCATQLEVVHRIVRCANEHTSLETLREATERAFLTYRLHVHNAFNELVDLIRPNGPTGWKGVELQLESQF
jgi:glycosyltransferase involved in cell wall biosynthesis